MRICDRCGVKEDQFKHENLVKASISFESPAHHHTSWILADLCQECANLVKDAVMDLVSRFEPKLH